MLGKILRKISDIFLEKFLEEVPTYTMKSFQELLGYSVSLETEDVRGNN
jgi:hypothetical protein